MRKKDFIEFPFLPITEQTFERQGWEMIEESDGFGIGGEDESPNTYRYYILPLPKDNPDEECPVLISSANDEWEELGLKKGEYLVQIADFFNLGMCETEEELEILYRVLTKQDLES